MTEIPEEAVRNAYLEFQCLYPQRSAGWDDLAGWEQERWCRIIASAAPIIVADCLRAAARDAFQDVIAAATEEATTARLAEIEAAVRADERERCVQEIFAYANEKLTPMLGAVYRDAARLLWRGNAGGS